MIAMRSFNSWFAAPLGAALLFSSAACSDNSGSNMTTPSAGNGGSAGSSGSGGTAGAVMGGAGGQATGGGGSGGAGAGGAAGAGGSGGAAMVGCVVPPGTDDPPMMLSQTGCINMQDPTKPAPGLVPYTVLSPLWSDDAKKERFVHVPEGQKIHVLDCAVETDACKDPGLGGTGEDDGHWDMPVGTVLVKNFSIEGKHIETRLLMRRSMLTWTGFSYQWNADQTEATLLPDNDTGLDVPVGTATQTWHYPSRSQCLTCHTKYAGRSLGPTTAQLNTDFPYAEGSMNQLAKFQQLGLLDAPAKDIKGYPTPADMATGTLEERARSYINANCAICHRPGGEFGSIDMRYGTSLIDSKMCEMIERNIPDLAPQTYRLVPGNPDQSVMLTRMTVKPSDPHGMLRMPKIGSLVVDPTGTAVVHDWIMGLDKAACPNQ